VAPRFFSPAAAYEARSPKVVFAGVSLLVCVVERDGSSGVSVVRDIIHHLDWSAIKREFFRKYKLRGDPLQTIIEVSYLRWTLEMSTGGWQQNRDRDKTCFNRLDQPTAALRKRGGGGEHVIVALVVRRKILLFFFPLILVPAWYVRYSVH
jgi:hypothetical protein